MTCQKAKYPDKATALQDIKEIRAYRTQRTRKTARNPKVNRKLRTYHCPRCGWWHLTTQKPRRKG